MHTVDLATLRQQGIVELIAWLLPLRGGDMRAATLEALVLLRV